MKYLALVLACTAVCAALTAGVGVALARSLAPEAQGTLEFKLGFKTLADQIPEIAGQPLENERYAANGDSLQATTGGLMVWRKADNWTGFTDGARSWIDGPFGLQERGNEERFDWEAGPTISGTQVILFSPTDPPSGDELEGRCWTDSLAVWRPNAWRCMADNQILDPCFSVEGNDTAVRCVTNPQLDSAGFNLRLTEPLPPRGRTPEGEHAWMLELADGTLCGLLTGATGGFDGQRLNYGCADQSYILGDPRPGPIWTVERVFLSADRRSIERSLRALVRTVWQ